MVRIAFLQSDENPAPRFGAGLVSPLGFFLRRVGRLELDRQMAQGPHRENFLAPVGIVRAARHGIPDGAFIAVAQDIALVHQVIHEQMRDIRILLLEISADVKVDLDASSAPKERQDRSCRCSSHSPLSPPSPWR